MEDPRAPSATPSVTAPVEDEGSGSKPYTQDDLEDRFEGLKMCGEEEIDLDFSEELDELIGDVRWLALFRVHTTKAFSHAAMFKQMRNAWAAAQDVTFKAMGTNLFLVQFQCLGDWNRVMDGGPWLFRGAAIVLAEYDGFSNVQDYKLDKLPVWSRIQGIPDGLMKKKELAEKVAKKVGEPPFNVIVNEGRINTSKYLRARIHLDLNTPLVRFVPINLKERKKYHVYYERLPDFCHFCGLIGHVVTECGDGIHEPDKCEWGDDLLVKYEPAVPTDGRGRGSRGGFGGRGRGAGGRPGDPNRYETEDMDIGFDDLDDEAKKRLAFRKRLINANGQINSPSSSQVEKGNATVADKIKMLEYGVTSNTDGMTTPQKVQVTKRPRKNGDDSLDMDDNLISATSDVEDRREQ
ncbi:hypothetical protein ACQ4PT_032634 [Festuca glaucescens]